MPEDPKEYRVENPAEAFERLKAGVKQALTVSKAEILRREREAKEAREKTRSRDASDLG